MHVAIVAGVVVTNDAISAAVEGQARLAAALPGVDHVTVFAQSIHRSLPCEAVTVSSSWELARHPLFRAADVAIFHWGIHYDLFDSITLLAAGAGPRPAVHFHNCTPVELIPDQREKIERSIDQIVHAIGLGVPMWTFSEFNSATLVEWGCPPEQISFVPFPIDAPPGLRHLPGRSFRLLAVGRLVPAKGIHVFVDALAQLPPEDRSRVSACIVSSARFSDPAYSAGVRASVDGAGLRRIVEFLDEPDDDELWHRYASSDAVVSPSFHEGLCVPIIEGYAAGCRAIGTTAGNLPHVVLPPDSCVAPGDPAALAGAISALLHAAPLTDGELALRRELVVRYSSAHASEQLQRGLRSLRLTRG